MDETVVQRLRASRLSTQDQDQQQAFAAGRRWAEGTAEWAMLERVDQHWDR